MPEPLTPGDGQDVLSRYKRAWEKRDPDLMMELYAGDAVFRPDPFDDELSGANAVRAHWNDLAAQRAQADFDAERTWVAGRTVLASWHAAYTVADTAERVRVRGFTTLELDGDGLISRQRDWPRSASVGIDSRHRPEPAGGGD